MGMRIELHPYSAGMGGYVAVVDIRTNAILVKFRTPQAMWRAKKFVELAEVADQFDVVAIRQQVYSIENKRKNRKPDKVRRRMLSAPKQVA